MLSRLLIEPGAQHAIQIIAWNQFVLARLEAQRDYGAARESHIINAPAITHMFT